MDEENNKTEEDEEVLNALDEARQFVDNITERNKRENEQIEQSFEEQINQNEQSIPNNEPDIPHPESHDTVYVKYRTEADIPTEQQRYFGTYKSAYGRHVALSNTYRNDNLRHLGSLDLQFIYDDGLPTLRQNSEQRRLRDVAEFQMCRGNPEIGGFEAKIGSTIIRRDIVDLKQAQTLTHQPQPKKSSILGFFRKKG